ncbi:MAG TPA: hypothetical protein VFX49_08980, partial [Chloroflexota bacterium]|nr:hypothetical protein [Chloroflexota bacterium]
MTQHARRPRWYRAAAGAAVMTPALVLALAAAPPALADTGGHVTASGGHAATLAAGAASMEVVHASYLDLTGNVRDLQSRVAAWQTGDDGSLGIAREKLERIDATLGHVQWPASLIASIGKARAATVPMQLALRNADQRAAGAAATTFGDVSHDLSHDFYGAYLPALKTASFTPMGPHAAYLDLTANIADLKSTVAVWQGGDEGSLGVAQEKAERIETLVKHVPSGGPLAKSVGAIQQRLKDVSAALRARNARAAQTALAPLSDASHDLTHDFYLWLGETAGVSDPACTQAAYLDLTANVADLRARVTAWQQGDEASLGVAQEKLDRIESVVHHVSWPRELSRAVYATGASILPMERALKARDVAAAQVAAARFGDASHDVTHDFYGVWLPVAHAPAGAAHGGAHGEADSLGTTGPGPAPDTKSMVLGAFPAVNAIV